LKGKALEKYWDYLALEAENHKKTVRLEKWRKAARNWLADYADRRAKDFVMNVVENVIKLKPSAKVLDVGCGPGKWTETFAKIGCAVTAIDISSKMIELAKKRLQKEKLEDVNFHLMNVSELNLPNNVYDMVNCVTVLQHIFDEEEWKKAVHEIVRVTKPGGYILLFEMAPHFTLKRHTSHLCIRTMKNYIQEFQRIGAYFVYWRAVDLSFPITFLGLRKYASSFSRDVYYFLNRKNTFISVNLLSFLSRITVFLAKPLDYKLGETPFAFLSIGKILLFKKQAYNL
jgi:ubiquinone/menaquinone biosynthesis C-methylase UbiE